MLLILGHIWLILGAYLFAWGLKIPLPPGSSKKKGGSTCSLAYFRGIVINWNGGLPPVRSTV